MCLACLSAIGVMVVGANHVLESTPLASISSRSSANLTRMTLVKYSHKSAWKFHQTSVKDGSSLGRSSVVEVNIRNSSPVFASLRTNNFFHEVSLSSLEVLPRSFIIPIRLLNDVLACFPFSMALPANMEEVRDRAAPLSGDSVPDVSCSFACA